MTTNCQIIKPTIEIGRITVKGKVYFTNEYLNQKTVELSPSDGDKKVRDMFSLSTQGALDTCIFLLKNEKGGTVDPDDLLPEEGDLHLNFVKNKGMELPEF